jgi:phospholipid/cholesterol/gamma-HCH transport system ATP-binding protein
MSSVVCGAMTFAATVRSRSASRHWSRHSRCIIESESSHGDERPKLQRAPERRAIATFHPRAPRSRLGLVTDGRDDIQPSVGPPLEGDRASHAPKTPMGDVLIRFSHVKKRFGPKVIYNDLDLEIRRGETTTILGASGSGKSVMLKMLIGLLKVDAGSIRFDGEELTKLSDNAYAKIRRRIAYLFQGAALFDSFTVGENVAYGLREQYWKTMKDDEIRARVAQSLELVGLPGIEEMRPSDLSGGMKKRVGLARTLALQPQVLLYDEPTTGLDPINTARINHLIMGIQKGLKITSIVVTHDMGTAFTVSNRLAMLGKGKVLAFGTQDEFKRTNNDYVRDFIEGKAPESEDVASLLSNS